MSINSLVLIGHVEILPSLYSHVVIPQAVAGDLQHPRTPEIIRAWIAAPPSWCTIQSPHGPPDGEHSVILPSHQEPLYNTGVP